jgi:fructose-bisphosphate aldolase, class II
MARITLRQLLDHASEHNYGVPAFNINNMEQALAIMEAANAVDAPVIIQASRGARSYANDIMLKHMMDAVTEIYPHIPVCVHLDHGNEAATCMTAIQAGFTSVMMDGSLKADGKTPANWDYNVAVTKQVTDMAHLGGISVEGELGVLGSLETGEGEAEDGHGAEGKLSHDQLLTNPDEAVKFVKETKVDALAIAMGTSHGAYKFSRKPDGKVLAMNVIEEIHAKLPNTHLVMHGSSSVPQDLQDIINEFGDLGRAGRGNPARHQARCAQDQHRHRQPHGHDWPDPQNFIRTPRRVRPPQVPEARHGRHVRSLQTAVAGVQHGGPSQQDQAHCHPRRNGQALRQRRAGPENCGREGLIFTVERSLLRKAGSVLADAQSYGCSPMPGGMSRSSRPPRRSS